MSGESLHNGIRLTEPWPPRNLDPLSRKVAEAPYLAAPPAVIPVDGRRQLFVDDFLIERTTLRRTYHQAEKYAGNPIFTPESPLEGSGARYRDAAGYSPPFACTFDDGVFRDRADGLFKMWYAARQRHLYCPGLQYRRTALGTARVRRGAGDQRGAGAPAGELP